MSRIIVIVGWIAFLYVGWLIFSTSWLVFYGLCITSIAFWISEENRETKTPFASGATNTTFSIKILISKSIAWIAVLYFGALILSVEWFVVYFICMIFIPLGIMDRRDEVAERYERRKEDAKIKKAHALYSAHKNKERNKFIDQGFPEKRR